MLRVEGVCAGYGGGDVVRNISFRLNKNENLAIIGPNGCGKTTLMKAIAGILPFRGEIKIQGESVSRIKHADRARKIAMLSQTSGIYFSYSVFETVMMGRYLHIKNKLFGTPSEYDRAFVMSCLEAVDLCAEADREITKLSGGQLQRVFLARTLAQEPEIILLDEPTNHLDLKYQIELIEYLRGWSAMGERAVIGVLHDINLAMRMGGKIMLMKKGESLAYGVTEEVISDSLLEEVYEIDVAGYMREALRRWSK